MDRVPKKAILHIGTHKTGTTLFQLWLRIHRQRLSVEHGINIYQGLFHNNRKIALLCAESPNGIPSLGNSTAGNTIFPNGAAYLRTQQNSFQKIEHHFYSGLSVG